MLSKNILVRVREAFAAKLNETKKLPMLVVITIYRDFKQIRNHSPGFSASSEMANKRTIPSTQISLARKMLP